MPRIGTIALALTGLLACNGGDTEVGPTVAAPPPLPPSLQWDESVRAPEGFALMDSRGVAALKAGALRGTATDAELEAWASPRGPAEGLVVSMRVSHAVSQPVVGHTLASWVEHQLQRVESGLASVDAEAAQPTTTQEGPSMRTHYSIPLPSGGALRVRGRSWLSASGHLEESICQCAGTGCTEPPACRLEPPPSDALPPDTILGDRTPTLRLTTARADASVEAPPHLVSLPAEVLTDLVAQGAASAPERSDRHVQGVHATDGSGAFLNDATWCVDTPACSAGKVAENRRKAEVASLRDGGNLRAVRTRSDPHGAVPTYGYEIEQRDGFWTRTTFWNDGGTVREVTCACAGLACALVKRTCRVTPS